MTNFHTLEAGILLGGWGVKIPDVKIPVSIMATNSS